MRKRLRLDALITEPRKELEKKYVHYVPDKGRVFFSKVCENEQYVETLPAVDGWHLIFLDGYPYLISHSAICFRSLAFGLKAWEYHEKENQRFFATCYSNRALGARGSVLTAEEYKTLSVWIKSTAGTVSESHVFLASKRRRGIYYEIATAVGSEVVYRQVADTASNAYLAPYTFRPSVRLSPLMYLVIDDEHDGSTPEKGMLLEPAKDYNPSKFQIGTSVGTDELTTAEFFEFMDTLREFVKSPLYAKLKPILEALEKE